MRLIVDTTTGLAIINKGSGFDCLDAVIIGTSPVPAYIELLDDGHVSLAPEKLAEILNPRDEREHDEFREALVRTLARDHETITVGADQRIRVPVVEWLA